MTTIVSIRIDISKISWSVRAHVYILQWEWMYNQISREFCNIDSAWRRRVVLISQTLIHILGKWIYHHGYSSSYPACLSRQSSFYKAINRILNPCWLIQACPNFIPTVRQTLNLIEKFHCGDKTVVMEFPILVRRHLYIESGPISSSSINSSGNRNNNRTGW